MIRQDIEVTVLANNRAIGTSVIAITTNNSIGANSRRASRRGISPFQTEGHQRKQS
jgi:hypothetical protein